MADINMAGVIENMPPQARAERTEQFAEILVETVRSNGAMTAIEALMRDHLPS